ncbi:hypothetical protein BGZ60DRAFT_95453 [Tricladium varicosporioides]|nr:hypothetical protein BGZ60DRAFT_95453 [Hymenoscyphus varicosporioides]
MGERLLLFLLAEDILLGRGCMDTTRKSCPLTFYSMHPGSSKRNIHGLSGSSLWFAGPCFTQPALPLKSGLRLRK